MEKIQEKKKYDVVFVVLTYRNTTDIIDFYNSTVEQVRNFKIIIVNNHYDEATTEELKRFALEHSCDFYDIPNKGYGTGNNYGINKALAQYDFKYLAVSNPDIIIKKFDTRKLPQNGVIGPEIVARSGKHQNPYWAVENRLAQAFIYEGFKKRNFRISLIGIAFNKIIREAFYKKAKADKKRSCFKVYAVHGSFVIFARNTLEKLGAPYDENMFLFWEEALLAYRCKEKGIRTWYCKDILVNHKEDGSMDLAHIDDKKELRKSFIYYYQKYMSNRQL